MFALSWAILLVDLVVGCNTHPVAIYGVGAFLGYSWVALPTACNADLVAIYGVCLSWAILGLPWS